MKGLAGRRWRHLAITAFLAALILAAWWLVTARLGSHAYLSGWSLLGVTTFLLLYNARKKLTFLPLASSAAWLQLHIYAGWLSILLFLLHVNWTVPNGWFEGLLAALFAGAALSGAVGIWMSRVLARRLTEHGESALYERIPLYRNSIRARAEELVLQSVAEGDATTIADFYSARLLHFFDRPRHFWHHLSGSLGPRQDLLRDLHSLRRYLKDAERRTLDQLEELVRVKDDLDYQSAAQSILKYWLFIHIPISYATILFVIVHVATILAFSGVGGGS